MYRGEKKNVEKLDIKEVVRDIVEIDKNEIKRNDIEIDIDIKKGMKMEIDDSVKIKKVIGNIVIKEIEEIKEKEKKVR